VVALITQAFLARSWWNRVTERYPSNTAFRAAILRAVHQLIDKEPKILNDPIVLGLLDASTLDYIRLNADKFRTHSMNALRSHIVMRSRYAEDRLAEAVQNGVQQYLILGAGLDTFPYRQPQWARALHIFEIDHSASQHSKRERLAMLGVEVPSNVELLALDFETTPLQDCLCKSSFDLRKPAFLSWLGVTMYLSTAAVDAIFRFVSSLPKMSEIVFTYASPASTLNESGGESLIAAFTAFAAAHGEPWRTFFEPNDLTRKLHGLGFLTVSFLSTSEADARYFRGRHDGLHAPRKVGIVTATV
jgi:methyltransferase (TIGR00027 family)